MQKYTDEQLMKKALELARFAEGQTLPNPMVGAIILKEGQIIGQGYHERPGTPHAEIKAIQAAAQDLKGSTLICTLEPCCHERKRTPPCLNEILKQGIKKVIVASLDPNPQVAGKGIEELKKNGVEVLVGICEKEEQWLNRRYRHFIQTGRPYIHAKWAQGLDGSLTLSNGVNQWITNERSRQYVHYLRAINQTILTSTKTILKDNPKLDLRHGMDKSFSAPDVFIIGDGNKLSSDQDVFKIPHRKVMGFCDETQNLSKMKHFSTLINASKKSGLKEKLTLIGDQGIASLFIEAGPTLLSRFIEEELINELSLFLGPLFLGKGPRVTDGLSWNSLKEVPRLHWHKHQIFDQDFCLEGTFQPNSF